MEKERGGGGHRLKGGRMGNDLKQLGLKVSLSFLSERAFFRQLPRPVPNGSVSCPELSCAPRVIQSRGESPSFTAPPLLVS